MESATPFKTRGLAAAAAAGVSSPNRHHTHGLSDERSLGLFASEYEQSRQQHGGAHKTPGAGELSTPMGARIGGGSSSSPRSYGLFGGFGSSGASFGTPPYATSLRDGPLLGALPNLSFAGSAGGGSAVSSGNHGALPGASPAGGTFSFPLPGHRYALDDPRADADLHETFHAQLRAGIAVGGTGNLKSVSAGAIDQWSRNMRAWIVGHVLRPLLNSLEQSNAALGNLASLVLANPSAAGAPLSPDETALLRGLAAAYGPAAAAQGFTGSTPLTARLVDAMTVLAARFPSRPEVTQRITIDKYLACEQGAEADVQAQANTAAASFGTSSFASVAQPATPTSSSVSSAVKAYVATRLQTLCAPGDDSLSKFQLAPAAATGLFGTRSGGLFGTRSSGAASAAAAAHAASAASVLLPNGAPAPSDAALVLHAFCTHMDGVRPGFRAQFVKEWRGNTLTHARMPPGAAASASNESFCIAQVRPPSQVPFFVLTHSLHASGGAGQLHSRRLEAVHLVTEPGRASLFQALVLFVIELPKGAPLLRELASVVGRDAGL